MDVLFPTDSTPSIEHSLSASFSFFFFFQLHSNFVKKSSILMKEGKEQLDKEKSFSNDGHCGTYRSKYEILHSGWINRQHSSSFKTLGLIL